MEHLYRISFILVSSILLQACSSVNYYGSHVNLIQNTSIEKVTEENIENIDIFYKKLPNYDFEEIAIVEGIAAGEDAGLEHVFRALKQQAALAQGDGVFKIEIERYKGAKANLHATGIIVRKK